MGVFLISLPKTMPLCFRSVYSKTKIRPNLKHVSNPSENSKYENDKPKRMNFDFEDIGLVVRQQ